MSNMRRLVKLFGCNHVIPRLRSCNRVHGNNIGKRATSMVSRTSTHRIKVFFFVFICFLFFSAAETTTKRRNKNGLNRINSPGLSSARLLKVNNRKVG